MCVACLGEKKVQVKGGQKVRERFCFLRSVSEAQSTPVLQPKTVFHLLSLWGCFEAASRTMNKGPNMVNKRYAYCFSPLGNVDKGYGSYEPGTMDEIYIVIRQATAWFLTMDFSCKSIYYAQSLMITSTHHSIWMSSRMRPLLFVGFLSILSASKSKSGLGKYI